MTALRKLNAKGIEAFSNYLSAIRAGTEFEANPAVLYVDEFSAPVRPRVEIENRKLKTKFDAALYLTEVLAQIETSAILADAGLWSWLALFFFDQLSPVRADGKRRPRENYHYIPNDVRPERHLLAGAYKIYRMHGGNARVLLHPAVHQHGRFIFDLDFRRDLLTNRGLVEVIDRLYWNPKTKRPKRGASSDVHPGSLRRLIAVVQQFDLNFDLYGMSSQEIMRLLPAEFEPWTDQGQLLSLPMKIQ